MITIIMTPMSAGSSPLGDIVNGFSASRPNTQSKRAACDRCRGQKLKCLREERNGNFDNGKCTRCNTAGAVCSFSASKRAGRPTASASSNPMERKGRGKGAQVANKSKQSGFAERSKNDVAEGQQGEYCDRLLLGRAMTVEEREGDELLGRPLNDSSMQDSDREPLADLPWADESTPAFYDGANRQIFESFGNGYNWSLQTALSTSHLTQAGALGNNAIPAHFKASNNQMSEPPPLAFDQRALDMHIGAPSGEMEEEGSMDFSVMSFTPKPKDLAESASGISSGGPSSEPSISGDDTQHRRMLELSELGMSLYSQLIANEEYHQTQASTGSLGLKENFVGSILKSSATFLNILTSFYPSASIKHPASKIPVFDPNEGEDETSTFGDFSDLANPTGQTYNYKRTGSSTSISTANEEDTRPAAADMTTVFQLLTCFIRIIRLHSIFYTQVHNYLTALPSKREESLPPIFPGMQVGGVPLDEFRNFQVKLLLQISTHVLGEIEMLLGLPDGYRISKKNPQSQGILETSVSVQFIEMMMRENGRCGFGIEWDRIKSIRDNLGNLRVLLKGTINI